MDSTILLYSAFAGALFFLMHILFLRWATREEIFTVLKRSYIAGAGVLLVSVLFHFLSITECVLAFLLYTLSSMLYVLGVFGIFDSSIRIDILSRIYQNGGGMTRKELQKNWRERYLVTRLHRLRTSDELDTPFSYFAFHYYLLQWMKKVYG